MISRSPEEIIEDNVAAMGEEPGRQFSALWQELADIHSKWGEFIELFSKTEARIDLLNRAAPAFFGMLQNEMWENILLHLARLTDKPKTVGKSNLTVQNFPAMISDASVCATVEALIEVAVERTEFCRDWRNRVIAHQDLDLALDRPPAVLQTGSKVDVDAALEALVNIMDEVSIHFTKSGVGFDSHSPPGGAFELLTVLADGVREQESRRKRFEEGAYTQEDLESSRWQLD
jgi:hypothetical protein